MQEQPEKNVLNYNEYKSHNTPESSRGGEIHILPDVDSPEEWVKDIKQGYRLVNEMIDEILGRDNMLTSESVVLPEITVVSTFPSMPNCAGFYTSETNQITLIADKVRSCTKVFIHEYLHFLSHNGKNDLERVSEDHSLAMQNNVGFRRDFGIDIREGKEGKLTHHYFLSFNEAVTEQLSIDIFPGQHETYQEYRGLLNQVLEDAVYLKIGCKKDDGVHQPWSRDEVKDYIYLCFFKGDLKGFTDLLSVIYQKYDITEQEFGLMTNKYDLPSVIEEEINDTDPKGPTPSPSSVSAVVKQRLNRKTKEDYPTDILDPEGPDGDGPEDGETNHGQDYDEFINENEITIDGRQIIEGVSYEIDSMGYIVYRGSEASKVITRAKKDLTSLVSMYKNGEIEITEIEREMDRVLFEQNFMSMLSDGFRDFYIYKHKLIGTLS